MEITRPKVTPKDFFLWLGAMVALYWSVVAFIFLIFSYIDYALPNVLAYRPDPYQGGMPYEMASLLVLTPLYIALSFFIRNDIRRDPTRKEIWVRRWAIILTLFVAGATVAVDVITLLTTFFRGEELTTAFLLKVLLVLLVAAAGFAYFALDLRDYWDRFRGRARSVSVALGVLVVLSILGGFFIVGTPMQARLYRFDDQKVSDLQNIQYQIVNYWQQQGELPGGLSDLNDPLSGYAVPSDPESGASYEYAMTGRNSFNLCAMFNAISQPGSSSAVSYPSAPVPAGASGDLSASNWQHGAGEVCFTRSIDASKYPILKK